MDLPVLGTASSAHGSFILTVASLTNSSTSGIGTRLGLCVIVSRLSFTSSWGESRLRKYHDIARPTPGVACRARRLAVGQ